MTTSWWSEIDDEILAGLAGGDAVTPAQLARRLEMSEAAVASCLAMLAGEGKVHIALVELAGARVVPARAA